MTAAFGVFYIATFFVLTHGTSSGLSLSVQAVFKMIAFFFVMIGGGPFDANVYVAAFLGVIVFATLVVSFIRFVIVPWQNDRKVDPGLAGLFALAVFLLAAAAATADVMTAS